MSLRAISIALALLATGLRRPPQDARGLEVVSSQSAQFYVLERPGAERREAVGLLVLDRAPGLLELQIHYGERDLHVHQVESSSASERRLVWREYGASALRTWTVVETEGREGLEVTSWGLGEPTRKHVETRSRVLFPLACIEILRRGEDVSQIVRAWPLSASLEVLDVRRLEATDPALPADGAAQLSGPGERAFRAYRLIRADGTAAESLLFDGDVLSQIELQPGDTCARLVDADRAEELLARFAREPERAPDTPDGTR